MMRPETANILSFLEEYMRGSAPDIAMKLARDFKQRRIEKNLSQDAISKMTGVSLGSLKRFEQQGLISLSNLIPLARALGHDGELANVFAEAKYSTMDELQMVRRQRYKMRAYPKKPKNENGDGEDA